MRWLATLALVAMVAACGGGGGSSTDTPAPTPAPERATTLDRYLPFYMGGQRLHGVVVNRDTGEQYTEWFASGNQVRWSPLDAEQLDVRECAGKRWSFLLGFVDDRVGKTWPLVNVKTLFNGVELKCPQDGVPYQPYDVPAGGVDVVEQWGRIDDSQPFYWKAQFTYGTTAENPCWTGDGPKLRPVIVQREVWWDQNGGWVRGSAPTLPWINGAPAPVTPTLDWEVLNAQDAGILWLGGNASVRLCLKNVTAW